MPLSGEPVVTMPRNRTRTLHIETDVGDARCLVAFASRPSAKLTLARAPQTPKRAPISPSSRHVGAPHPPPPVAPRPTLFGVRALPPVCALEGSVQCCELVRLPRGYTYYRGELSAGIFLSFFFFFVSLSMFKRLWSSRDEEGPSLNLLRQAEAFSFGGAAFHYRKGCLAKKECCINIWELPNFSRQKMCF